MSRVPDHVLEQIRHSVSLADIITEDGVELRRKGRSLMAPCPFHDDKDPSFSVHPAKGFYNCFSCPASGDIFKWLEKKRGMSFVEALKYAAGRAGVDISEYLEPQRQRNVDPRAQELRELLAALHSLSTTTAAKLSPEEYPVKEANTAHLVDSGDLGRIPSKNAVRDHLSSLGFSKRSLHESGLVHGIDELEDNWVLWALTRSGRVWAGAPVHDPARTIGAKGAQSTGWVYPSGAIAEARIQEEAILTPDPHLYLWLRNLGLTNVFFAVGPDRERIMDKLPVKGVDPVLWIPPTREARVQAFEDALSLLSHHPRLRVAEIEAQETQKDAEQMCGHLRTLSDMAGTVFDWQYELMAEHDLFSTDEGRRTAADKLSRIVQSVQSPVEREAYRIEAESATNVRMEGLGVDVGGSQPDPPNEGKDRKPLATG